MRRTIAELIEATFAGEKITPAEAKRALRHSQHMARADQIVMRDSVVPDEIGDPGEWSLGRSFPSYRNTIRRNLRTYSEAELRRLVRELLHWLGAAVELLASDAGSHRRGQSARQRGGQRSGVIRRETTATIQAKVAALMQASPGTTLSAAVRRYLRENDPEWPSAADAERRKKIEATLRRLRTRTKKADTK
jgi:hypothetical protein